MASASYNPRKAAQVIAYLAIKSGACLPVLKAVKLVYLADRESLARLGFPILDESHVSMPHGPVNSSTYSHINGEEDLDACGWTEFLRAREGHNVSIVEGITEDDLDELSDADIACLDVVWEKFGGMDKWEIRDWTHDRDNIPEWEDPHGSLRPIPLERMLSYLNVPQADAQADLIREHRTLNEVFAALRR
jgi:uncharacterized phage-associated protein